MKIESLDEAIRISDLTGLSLKLLLTEKMLKMTQKQYDSVKFIENLYDMFEEKC